MVRRSPAPAPWVEGEKIPWDDPAFSERMLQEHLSLRHDLASRRPDLIDRHVAWIHRLVLGGPSRVLDLGCGPGLYTKRLAALGHRCVGIDFGPASIRYAREEAASAGLDVEYVLGDVRLADYPGPFDLVMLIFGEFNAFRREDARAILERVCRALSPGGQLLLEAHPLDAIRRHGERPARWSALLHGLFSDEPHLLLEEHFWDGTTATETVRYYVVDASTARVTRHAASAQAYTDDEYRALLDQCGFEAPRMFPSLSGEERDASEELVVGLTRRGRSVG